MPLPILTVKVFMLLHKMWWNSNNAPAIWPLYSPHAHTQILWSKSRYSQCHNPYTYQAYPQIILHHKDEESHVSSLIMQHHQINWISINRLIIREHFSLSVFFHTVQNKTKEKPHYCIILLLPKTTIRYSLQEHFLSEVSVCAEVGWQGFIFWGVCGFC